MLGEPNPSRSAPADAGPPIPDPAKTSPSSRLPKPLITTAPKSQAAAPGHKTPAEYLGLTAKARAKAEKCLANAVYFEARSEPVRGQIAVAQVVLNRAFSGYYPDDVCGVVYQNAHRTLSCQFTFACDNNKDVIREPDMWERAQKISRAMLDGQLWLPEDDRSTHYHA